MNWRSETTILSLFSVTATQKIVQDRIKNIQDTLDRKDDVERVIYDVRGEINELKYLLECILEACCLEKEKLEEMAEKEHSEAEKNVSEIWWCHGRLWAVWKVIRVN